MRTLLACLILCACAQPQDPKPLDKKFVAMTSATAFSLALDGYTTSWIRPRWHATPQNQYAPCVVEMGEPSLFGREPTVKRIAAVQSLTFGAIVGASYLIRRTPHIRKLWAVPMAVQMQFSLTGAIHNIRNC